MPTFRASATASLYLPSKFEHAARLLNKAAFVGSTSIACEYLSCAARKSCAAQSRFPSSLSCAAVVLVVDIADGQAQESQGGGNLPEADLAMDGEKTRRHGAENAEASSNHER